MIHRVLTPCGFFIGIFLYIAVQQYLKLEFIGLRTQPIENVQCTIDNDGVAFGDKLKSFPKEIP